MVQRHEKKSWCRVMVVVFMSFCQLPSIEFTMATRGVTPLPKGKAFQGGWDVHSIPYL